MPSSELELDLGGDVGSRVLVFGKKTPGWKTFSVYIAVVIIAPSNTSAQSSVYDSVRLRDPGRVVLKSKHYLLKSHWVVMISPSHPSTNSITR